MRNRISNSLWGLFFILIGVGIAGNILFDWNFDFIGDGWWTLFIIIPCLISMIRTKFNAAPTIGFIIGVLLFVNYYIKVDIDFWKLIVPAVLILIGLKIIFQGTYHRRNMHFENTSGTNSQTNFNNGQQTYSNVNQREYNSIFSSNHIRMDNEVFTGTSLSAVFGAIVLDLRNAVVQNDVEINATAVFGGIDIYIPRGVNIKINNVPIFGGVSNKTTSFNDPSAPTIYLNSTCMFGGIDIK